MWIVTQFFSELGALMTTDTGGGVAYMAHIGGFIYGAVAARVFEDPRRIAEQRWNE
jgi:membrane associated rhomboid family serine protease